VGTAGVGDGDDELPPPSPQAATIRLDMIVSSDNVTFKHLSSDISFLSGNKFTSDSQQFYLFEINLGSYVKLNMNTYRLQLNGFAQD
jgi:hypothetical protein